MAKFKPGDYVRVLFIENSTGLSKRGTDGYVKAELNPPALGVIIRLYSPEKNGYIVEFSVKDAPRIQELVKTWKGPDLGIHDCCGEVPSGRGRYVLGDAMTLAEVKTNPNKTMPRISLRTMLARIQKKKT